MVFHTAAGRVSSDIYQKIAARLLVMRAWRIEGRRSLGKADGFKAPTPENLIIIDGRQL